MNVYLSTPGNQLHDHCLEGMPVLLSYGARKSVSDRYARTFGRVMLDSGAYTVFNSGGEIDLDAYAAWCGRFPWADACAALDDIAGDWELGLSNWDRYPWQFATYHETDPPEALDAILKRMADRRRSRMRRSSLQWIGLGMVPPRRNGAWLADALDRIPPGIHVHGFALRGFARQIVDARGSDCSFDSVNWLLDSRQVLGQLPWLTPAEAVEIIVKRYRRSALPEPKPKDTAQQRLFT